MNCGFREEFYYDTLECIISLDLLRKYPGGLDILYRYLKKYEVEKKIMVDFFYGYNEIIGKCKSSKEKNILFQDIANKFCDYYMESKMKNCCNCCKCCCQNKCCNKKDDDAIKIDVEKEIEMFTQDFFRKIQSWFAYDYFFSKKIKNTPTIEIRCNRTKTLIDYIEDCLTSNHREFSLDEKIEAVELLNKFVKIRAEEWLSDIKNAIR